MTNLQPLAPQSEQVHCKCSQLRRGHTRVSEVTKTMRYSQEGILERDGKSHMKLWLIPERDAATAKEYMEATRAGTGKVRSSLGPGGGGLDPSYTLTSNSWASRL